MERAVALPPEQLSLILLKLCVLFIYFFLDAALEKLSTLGSLKIPGHMLPYFPFLLYKYFH